MVSHVRAKPFLCCGGVKRLLDGVLCAAGIVADSTHASPLPLTLTTVLPQPAVSLFHLCVLTAASSQPPTAVVNLAARVTPTQQPPTVFLRWQAPVRVPSLR